MSISELYLPLTTTTSPSLYTTSLNAKICLAMKCVVISNYSQRSIDEVPDLLVIIFPASKIAGNVTLGRVKLADVINCGLKKYCLED